MAILKIDDIDLFVGLTQDAHDCWQMKKFLEDHNIKYRTMMYADDSQHEVIFYSMSEQWAEEFNKFPLLTYTEIDFDLAPSQYPKKIARTVEDLQSTHFVQLAVKNN